MGVGEIAWAHHRILLLKRSDIQIYLFDTHKKIKNRKKNIDRYEEEEYWSKSFIYQKIDILFN